jgi:energy-coupling factor transport system ATP-binding protein
VGLRDDQLDNPTIELSGGQQRRVAIAGVIAMEPKVLFLDEPTAGLDPVGVESILDNIRDYHQAHNATVILVSHSMEEVARTVDRLVVVNDGILPFSGTPRDVFYHGAQLERMGLGVPQMTRVFHRLREMGVDIDPSVYTIQQAKASILAKKGVG